jgi:hypothetical protein
VRVGLDQLFEPAGASQRARLAASLLPPIVFHLNGDGVKLTKRNAPSARFDADGDDDVERTGWFSASDGVLDRNGDGLINNGLEISFARDLVGAVTDLEGLGAYDTNQKWEDRSRRRGFSPVS